MTCQYPRCPTPEVFIDGHSRKYHTACAVAVQRECWRRRHQKDPNRPIRKYTQKLPLEESPEAIEAAYKAALAEIKARPRGEPDLRWYSPLHGLKGTGL